ncbi:hypothetical protein ES288_A06G134100v1 [Gossypium darwinii]|uniref:TAF6 C-terminal HEAT repeat domain-containing protein n=1 Tax=Gossypium darwinii TaxID=34276 RepID=A0A5D2G5G8_GOSDA|nr:hypothetical protein ES288_A06G134100v1 [Gossypium darwinii]
MLKKPLHEPLHVLNPHLEVSAMKAASFNTPHFPSIITKRISAQPCPTRFARTLFLKLPQSFQNNPFFRPLANSFASSLSSASSSSKSFIESTANGMYLGWNKAPKIEIDGGGQAKALGFGERGRWSQKSICGFASRDALRFKKPTGHKDLFYIDDKDVETTNTTITSHWLAIEGIQPTIPENASIEAPSDGKKAEYKEDGISIDVKLPIKHVLSRELQLYFDKIVDITMNKSVSILFKQALLSLATDSRLHPLVPYFTCFIFDEVVLKIFHTSLYMRLTFLPHLSQVAQNLNNFPLMFALMRVARSFLQNEHLHIETYLMPSFITCLVTKRLGNKFIDNHWELRNFAAKLKIATESAIGMMPINSMQNDLQGAVSDFSTTIGGSNIGVSSMSWSLSNNNMLGRDWGSNPGNLLASLFKLFGEIMLSFTPKPDLSFFL